MLNAVPLFLFSLTLAGAPEGTPPAPAELTVEVGKLRNLRGVLGCQIFERADGFPSQGQKAKARQEHVPQGNFVTCSFKDLPPGQYAVAVIHDEDQDGILETNFLGMPQEGYGASNNKLPGLSAPTFEDSRLTIGPGEKKTIKIELRY